jgi:hypothetical protein
MNQAAHQEPRHTPRQRVDQVVHVDVAHSAAAEQLAITAHVDMRLDEAGGPARYRPVPPAGLKAAIAAAIQAVIDEHMPFPAAEQPATAAEQPFEGSDSDAELPDGAEPASAAKEVQA